MTDPQTPATEARREYCVVCGSDNHHGDEHYEAIRDWLAGDDPPRPARRYVLWAGEVISQSDGDRHYIGVGQLRELYRIPPDAHVVDGHERGFRPLPGDVNCRPRYDGNYPADR